MRMLLLSKATLQLITHRSRRHPSFSLVIPTNKHESQRILPHARATVSVRRRPPVLLVFPTLDYNQLVSRSQLRSSPVPDLRELRARLWRALRGGM
jgi:hypothetical protein